MSDTRTRALLAGLCLLLAIAQIWMFRWGVILPDTVVQYGQVLTGRYADWHPPVTAWLWRWIGGARWGSAPFLILVCTAAWAGLGLTADAVRRRSGLRSALAVVAVGLVPILFGELGAILKDSLLAAALLLATGLLAEAEPPGWRRIAAALLLLLAACTRFNAFFAAAPLAALIVPTAWRRGWLRHGALIAGAGALLFGTATFINQVVLAPAREQPFLSLVAFDLAGTTVESGRNHIPFLDAATARATAARCYDRSIYNIDEDEECDLQDRLKAYIDRTHQSGIAIWLREIVGDPIAYAAHRLGHFNRNQRWYVPSVPDDAVYLTGADNDFGLAYRPSAAAKAVGAAAKGLAGTPLGRPATWLAVAVGLLLMGGRLRSAALVRALALSALAYGGGYLIVSVAPDLRYNLWTMVAAMLGLLIALAERAAVPARLWALAAIPATVAIIGEVAGLVLTAR